MKTKFLVLIACVAVTASAFARISPSHGIAGLRISLTGSNVVLFWPSLTNQVFYVQHAPDLNPGTLWTTLAANYPAEQGTNRTSFVHSNSVTYPDCPTSTNGGGGSLEGPPGFNSMVSVQTEKGTLFVTQAGEVLTVEDILPYPWNPRYAPKAPPLPPAQKQNSGAALNAEAASGGANMMMSGGCAPTMGFYRVFIPAPQAIGDVFSVAQGSTTNQLPILANDSDPEGNGFLLSNVTAAAHGTIQYTDDAGTFRYTPVANYWGMDTFIYTLTNEVGGFAGTNGWVFVNKTGNANPSASALSFDLLTNQTQITFPGLTNAADANSDSLSIALLFQPSHGVASTNTNNVIIYTRTSAVVAQDAFSYVITDGRGGFVRRTVTILPQDSDGDGMPDEWERQHGLNVLVADGTAEPDGDGLPNLAEYKLHTSPQVSDSPLGLPGVSVGQKFSDYSRVPLALAASIDPLPITLLQNGDGTESSLEQAADGSWYIRWDTGYLTNGPATIGLTFQYNPDASITSTNGPTKSVTVTNEVIFNSLNSEFSSAWWVDLTFAYQNANWEIDLWDEGGGGLVYFTGSTTNGKVTGSWNLVYNGQQISFGNIRADVYVAPAGNALPNKPNGKRWFLKQITGGIGNDFVVAWGWDAYGTTFQTRRTDLMLDGVLNIIGDPSAPDEYTLKPSANAAYASAFRYDTDDDKEILMNALTNKNSGNFFWFGHGAIDAIQGNAKNRLLMQGTLKTDCKTKSIVPSRQKFSFGTNTHTVS